MNRLPDLFSTDLSPSLRRCAIAGLAVVLCMGGGPSLAASTPAQRIAYTSDRPVNRDLVLIDLSDPPHPSFARRATPGSIDSDPTLSRDGRWIVYSGEREGNQDLYLLPATPRADFLEATPIRLTFARSAEGTPALSPDGKWLAYTSSRAGRAEIWMQPLRPEDPRGAAAEARNLTPGPGSDYRPAFSPDGRWLTFSSTRGGTSRYDTDLYVLETATGTVSPAPHSDLLDGSPRFTADGKALVFQRSAATGGVVKATQERFLFKLSFDGSDPDGPRFGEAEKLSAGDGEEVVPTPLPGDGLAYLVAVDHLWKAELGGDLPPEAADLSFFSLATDSTGRRFVASVNTPDDEGLNPFAQRPSARSPMLSECARTIPLPDRVLSTLPIHLIFPSFDGRGRVVGGDLLGHLVRATWDGRVVGKVEAQTGDAVKEAGPLGIVGHSADPLSDAVIAQVGSSFAPPQVPTDVWFFEADGRGRNLTPEAAENDGLPRFSPDGRRIVFRSGRDGNHEIYLMDRDGTHLRRLTDNEATDTAPALSPDGRRLAFTSTRDGNHEIYLLELTLDGTPDGEPRRLTTHPGIDMHPFFSPDGAWLVFASDRGGEPDEIARTQMRFSPQPGGELWVMRLADGYLVRLTHNLWEDGLPVWGLAP